jgi:hypothetical protein
MFFMVVNDIFYTSAARGSAYSGEWITDESADEAFEDDEYRNGTY